MAETRVRDIPEQLWREFRSMCALEGVTINEKMLEIIQKAVEQHKKGEP